MRNRPLRTFACLLPLAFAALAEAQPGSGTRWEMKMQMPGMDPAMQAEMEAARKQMEGMQLPEGMQMPDMSGGMMTQKMCMSRDTSEPPPANEDCTLLEQRSSRNRHFVKMQCPDGIMELDQTRTESTMKGTMKLTAPDGTVTEMAMEGRALGDCDYTAEVDAQRRQVAAIQKQADDARRQSEAQIAKMCAEALDKMQGVMFGEDGACATRRAEFCKRVQTIDGFRLFRSGIPEGAEQMPGYDAASQLKACGLTEKAVLAKLCPQAARAGDFRFVDAYCPLERPQLCALAVEREELWYIARHCDAARAQLVAQHCAGRKYSSQIAEKYRDFCTGALGKDLGAGEAGGAGAGGEAPQQPADPVQQGVKKGLDGLKKIFGN